MTMTLLPVSEAAANMEVAFGELGVNLLHRDGCRSVRCRCGLNARYGAAREVLGSPEMTVPSLLDSLLPLNVFLGHAEGCSFRGGWASPDGDFCTCGVGERKRSAREALAVLVASLQAA